MCLLEGSDKASRTKRSKIPAMIQQKRYRKPRNARFRFLKPRHVREHPGSKWHHSWICRGCGVDSGNGRPGGVPHTGRSRREHGRTSVSHPQNRSLWCRTPGTGIGRSRSTRTRPNQVISSSSSPMHFCLSPLLVDGNAALTFYLEVPTQ